MITQCKTTHFWLNCSLLTGSCSNSNKLTTTMLISVPIVPSLKRLETYKRVENLLLLITSVVFKVEFRDPQEPLWGFQKNKKKKLFPRYIGNTMTGCMTMLLKGFIHFLQSTYKGFDQRVFHALICVRFLGTWGEKLWKACSEKNRK